MNTKIPPVVEESVLSETELEPAWASAGRTVRHLFARRPEDQPVLSIRATISERDAESFIIDALRDVRVYMQERDIRPVGPPFSICRPRGNEVDIEAGWPLAAPLSGRGRIHGGAIPRSLLEPETGLPAK
jgi:hypothetical protein